jgi:hypothetical protein
MEHIKTIVDLKNAIQLLEAKQANQWGLLKKQAYVTYENIKPVNILKNSLKGLVESPDLKDDLINTTVSMAAGYLSKKIAIGVAHNPLSQLVGTLLQIGVTSITSKNTDGIKAVGKQLLTAIFNKKKD